MKIIGRILIILVAATLIACLPVARVNITGAEASQTSGELQVRGNGGFAQGSSHPEHGSSASGSFSMTELIKNIAVVAATVVTVTAVESLWKVVRRKRFARVLVSHSQTGRKE